VKSRESVKDGARCDFVHVFIANAIQIREVVWEIQTTCAIVHFGPKSAPHRRDFGPGRKSLLRESVNHGARPDLVKV
jgi:hypothetical protein